MLSASQLLFSLKEPVIPNQVVLEQIELAELAQSVDDGRAGTDPFKVPAALRTFLNTRLADLKAKDAATLLTKGDRATASVRVRAALDQLILLLRDGYNFVQGPATRSAMPIAWKSSPPMAGNRAKSAN